MLKELLRNSQVYKKSPLPLLPFRRINEQETIQHCWLGRLTKQRKNFRIWLIITYKYFKEMTLFKRHFLRRYQDEIGSSVIIYQGGTNEYQDFRSIQNFQFLRTFLFFGISIYYYVLFFYNFSLRNVCYPERYVCLCQKGAQSLSYLYWSTFSANVVSVAAYRNKMPIYKVNS